MLKQAVDVVEVARRLDPRTVPGIPGMWKIGCQPRELPGILLDLFEALEAFDRMAGSGQDPFKALARAVRFAEERGIPRVEMINAMKGSSVSADDNDDDEVEEAAANVATLDPAPSDIGPADPTVEDPILARSPNRGTAKRTTHVPGASSGQDLAHNNNTLEMTAKAEAKVVELHKPNSLRHMVLIPKAIVPVGMAGEVLSKTFQTDVGNAIADADDQVVDFEGVVDAIEDRLEYIVGRLGSTPQVQRLRGALRKARQSLAMAEHGMDLNLAAMATEMGNQMIDIEAEAEPQLHYAPRPY